MTRNAGSDLLICPECGTETSAVPHCWLCGGSLQDAIAASEFSSSSAGAAARPVRRPAQLGIASLMLTMTLIAVLLGILNLAPGLGLVLILFVTPAFLRATVLATRSKVAGERLTIRQKLLAFGSSLGLIAALLMALGCTYLTCCAVGAVAYDLKLLDDDAAIIGSNAVGVLGQLAFTILFIRWLWVRRSEQKNRLGDIGFVFSWCGFAIVNTVFMIALTRPSYVDGDMVGWGLLGIPGVILSLLAIRRPHRSLASCGVGLGIAVTCVSILFIILDPGISPRTRGSGAQAVLMLLLVGNVLAAAVISAAFYHVAQEWEQRNA